MAVNAIDDGRDLLIHRYLDLEFVDEVYAGFKCGRCNRVLINHYFSNCNHAFCYNCKKILQDEGENKWKCPVPSCDQYITHVDQQRVDFDEKVSALRVCCPNKTYGCPVIGSIKEMQGHITQCRNTKDAALPAIYIKPDTKIGVVLDQIFKVNKEFEKLKETICVMSDMVIQLDKVEENNKNNADRAMEDLKNKVNAIQSDLQVKTTSLQSSIESITKSRHEEDKHILSELYNVLCTFEAKENNKENRLKLLEEKLNEKLENRESALAKEINQLKMEVGTLKVKLTTLDNRVQKQSKQVVKNSENQQNKVMEKINKIGNDMKKETDKTIKDINKLLDDKVAKQYEHMKQATQQLNNMHIRETFDCFKIYVANVEKDNGNKLCEMESQITLLEKENAAIVMEMAEMERRALKIHSDQVKYSREVQDNISRFQELNKEAQDQKRVETKTIQEMDSKVNALARLIVELKEIQTPMKLNSIPEKNNDRSVRLVSPLPDLNQGNLTIFTWKITGLKQKMRRPKFECESEFVQLIGYTFGVKARLQLREDKDVYLSICFTDQKNTGQPMDIRTYPAVLYQLTDNSRNPKKRHIFNVSHRPFNSSLRYGEYSYEESIVNQLNLQNTRSYKSVYNTNDSITIQVAVEIPTYPHPFVSSSGSVKFTFQNFLKTTSEENRSKIIPSPYFYTTEGYRVQVWVRIDDYGRIIADVWFVTGELDFALPKSFHHRIMVIIFDQTLGDGVISKSVDKNIQDNPKYSFVVANPTDIDNCRLKESDYLMCQVVIQPFNACEIL